MAAAACFLPTFGVSCDQNIDARIYKPRYPIGRYAGATIAMGTRMVYPFFRVQPRQAICCKIDSLSIR